MKNEKLGIKSIAQIDEYVMHCTDRIDLMNILIFKKLTLGSGKKMRSHETIRRITLVKPVSYTGRPHSIPVELVFINEPTHTHNSKTSTQTHIHTILHRPNLTLALPPLFQPHARNYQIQVPVCKSHFVSVSS